MAVTVGSGQYTYEVAESWGKLPEGWKIRNVAGVGVDSKDRVYVFNRGDHPVIVFDRDGNFLTSWGEGIFHRPHGVFMTPDDVLYLTDDYNHVVRKCTLDGKVLLEIGTPGKPAPYMSGQPFNRCTHTALSPSGDIYITDGYGNSRVHKYSPDGKLLMSWGEPGCLPGQFQIAHNVVCDADGWVYVADRENHRVQIFDGDGQYETQWNNLHRPQSLFLDRKDTSIVYIGETGPATKTNRPIPNLGPRISIVTKQRKLLARLGDVRAGPAPGQFLGPHGLAVDSRGDIYVGEGAHGNWPKLFPDQPAPETLRPLHKLIKIL